MRALAIVPILWCIAANAQDFNTAEGCMGPPLFDTEKYCGLGSSVEGSRFVVGKGTAINPACYAHDFGGRKRCLLNRCQFTGQPHDQEFLEACDEVMWNTDTISYGVCITAYRLSASRAGNCDTGEVSKCWEEGTGGNYGCYGCGEFEGWCGCGFSSPDCDKHGGICNAVTGFWEEPYEHEGVCVKPTRGSQTRCYDREHQQMEKCSRKDDVHPWWEVSIEASWVPPDYSGGVPGICWECSQHSDGDCRFHCPDDDDPCCINPLPRPVWAGMMRSNRRYPDGTCCIPAEGINYATPESGEVMLNSCIHGNRVGVYYWRGNTFFEWRPLPQPPYDPYPHEDWIEPCTPGQPMPGGMCIAFEGEDPEHW